LFLKIFNRHLLIDRAGLRGGSGAGLAPAAANAKACMVALSRAVSAAVEALQLY